MDWNSSRLRYAPATLLLIVLVGCDGGSPPLANVRGRVFFEGRPLCQGMIVFTPDVQRGGTGASAIGEIHSDGSYTLKTDGQPGACAGWHCITIAAVEAAAGRGDNQPRSLLPARYADPELSGQLREIKPGQENIIDLFLE